jgi:hypothetical protein
MILVAIGPAGGASYRPIGREPVIVSRDRALRGGFPQPFGVAHRRRSEEPLVVAGEVRGVAVAHAEAGTRGVQVLAEHEASGRLEAHPLLELQGAHRGDRIEVVVEARDAHPRLPRYVFDSEWPVEVLAQPLEGFSDAVGVATLDRDLTQPAALRGFRAEHVEAEVWELVRSLMLDPERLLEDIERMIEEERNTVHGDPDREAAHWLDSLAAAERKRGGFQDMAAEDLITLEELREKLADLDELRATAERELRAIIRDARTRCGS